MPICIVEGCSSTRRNPDVTLHQFPKDKALRDEWLKFCGCTDGPNLFVCSLHFRTSDYENIFMKDARKKLQKHAVPSIRESPSVESAQASIQKRKRLVADLWGAYKQSSEADSGGVFHVTVETTDCTSIEIPSEPEASDAACPEDPSDDEAHPTEADVSSECEAEEEEEEEYIGVDQQETRDSQGHDSELFDLLSTEIEIKDEIEIKEEEIELEEEDPIGGVEASGNTSTDTAEELENEPAKKQRKLSAKLRKSTRSHAQKQVSSTVPQFVPGLMSKINSYLLCLECGHRFSSAVSFALHRKQFHVQLPDFLHSCPYCARKFRERKNLQRHLLNHTQLEMFCCSVCHLALNSTKALVDHLDGHRNPNASHWCDLCEKRFFGADQLEAHNKDLHTQLPKIVKPVLPSDMVCFACGKTEQTSTNLHNHIQMHKGSVKCKICGSSQNNTVMLAHHVSKFHQTHRTITYDCCPNCNKVLLSQQQLIEHKAKCALPTSLQGRFRMECHICNMSYFDVEHYQVHMRLHAVLGKEMDRKHCHLCSFYSKNASEFAIHMTNKHGYRDTIESLENDLDKLPGIQCVVPKCKRTPISILTFCLPDPVTQPKQWNRLLQTFGLPAHFEPEPTDRICSYHLVIFNTAERAGK